ncbi:MAG: phospholipase D-like domain-containing protein [Candidatus Bipolaricaulota bacterium]|nr:phospholipase D-like domain-containing protein [Candidatus Bipolaricaulota bacterium]
MTLRLQRALLGVLVFVVLAGLAARAATRIVPLVDRPGRCGYCSSVEAAFAAARESIDLLLSDAELEGNPLWEPLVSAAARGVRVRALLDASDWSSDITEGNRPALEYLGQQGIEARFDDPAITTHAKLVVVDRRTVILGSSNWNPHAFYEQEQANVLVEDARVGEVFATYFDRLWAGDLPEAGITLDLGGFLGEGPLLVPLPEAPGTANYARILGLLLGRAERSVHVVMYRASWYAEYRGSLSNEVLQALIDAAARGLDVRVLLDDCAFFPDSAEANLEAALFLHLHGVEVRFDDPTATTHAKLVIVDGESVLLGSTNWNYYSLEKNHEVDLALINLPAVAEAYEELFRALWKSGRRLTE